MAVRVAAGARKKKIERTRKDYADGERSGGGGGRKNVSNYALRQLRRRGNMNMNVKAHRRRVRSRLRTPNRQSTGIHALQGTSSEEVVRGGFVSTRLLT